MNADARQLRLRAVVVSLLGLVALCVCMFCHTCMAGHLAHGQNPWVATVVDGVWILTLPLGAILVARSAVYTRSILSPCLVFLALSNALMISNRLEWYKPHQLAVAWTLLISVVIAVVGCVVGADSRFNKRLERGS